jgi:hypothetical protein
MQKRKIIVQDETHPQEVLDKKNNWAFPNKTPLRTVKLETKQQPQSLGINVTDSSETGEKIG